jgi:hypothetical protein
MVEGAGSGCGNEDIDGTSWVERPSVVGGDVRDEERPTRPDCGEKELRAG